MKRRAVVPEPRPSSIPFSTYSRARSAAACLSWSRSANSLTQRSNAGRHTSRVAEGRASRDQERGTSLHQLWVTLDVDAPVDLDLDARRHLTDAAHLVRTGGGERVATAS